MTNRMEKLTITFQRLSSGYLRIETQTSWCQIPADFCEPKIPDEYIFRPEWNRDIINGMWFFLREFVCCIHKEI